jgi:hypothetical protein
MATIYTGTYGSGTTAENALNTALMQYPEIARTLIQQYPRYAATYLLERTGRYAKEKVLGDNSFEWKVMGRYNAPTYMTGHFSTTGVGAFTAAGSVTTTTGAQIDDADANGDQFYLICDDTTAGRTGNFLNKWDMVRFQSGAVALVIEDPVPNTSGSAATTDFVVKFEMVNAVVGTTITNPLVTSDITDEAIVASIGSAFPNGSDGADVGENWVYPTTHKNWLTTMRKKCTVTGKDLTDVTWIENNGSRLWYFTREQQMMDEFMYQQELQRWYGRASISQPYTDYTSYATATSTSAIGTSGTMASSVVSGDGLLAQINSSNQASYSMGSLTEDIITEFIAKISLNATAAEGNEWVVFTGTEGRLSFHRAMKDLIVAPAGAMTGGSMKGTNGDVSLGANFVSYSALGNKITVAHNPVFDDPNLHSTAGGTNSFGDNRLKESAKMVFMDFGKTSGISNIELVTKGAEGVNRSMIKKYVAGMVNPYDQKSMLSANADDKFECHVLSESGIVVRNPLSCGVLSVS